MTFINPRADICNPKTLAVMDQAFAAVRHMLREDDSSCDCANDSEPRIAIGQKLLNLVAEEVTNPVRLRDLAVQSLLVSHH